MFGTPSTESGFARCLGWLNGLARRVGIGERLHDMGHHVVADMPTVHEPHPITGRVHHDLVAREVVHVSVDLRPLACRAAQQRLRVGVRHDDVCASVRAGQRDGRHGDQDLDVSVAVLGEHAMNSLERIHHLGVGQNPKLVAPGRGRQVGRRVGI